MRCEICNTQTATMWVEAPEIRAVQPSYKLPSCDDCGPQLGYKILAPLTTNIRS